MAASACNATPVASRLLGVSMTMMPVTSSSVATVMRPIFRQRDSCGSSMVLSQMRGIRAYHSVRPQSYQKNTCILRNIKTTRTSNKPLITVSLSNSQNAPQIRQFSNSSALRLFGSKGNRTEGYVRPKKRFRLLRWTFRLTYLSLILGIGYIGYGIYVSRSPAEQVEPDPNKKTLVVLGMFLFYDLSKGDQDELK